MPDRLQQIKRHIKSVESTQKITNAMKLVSASRLRTATIRFHYVKSHLTGVTEMLGALAAAEKDSAGAMFQRGQGPALNVCFAGSKGFCGSFNTMIRDEMFRQADRDADSAFLPAGRKTEEYCSLRNLSTPEGSWIALDDLTYDDCLGLADRLTAVFAAGGYEEIALIRTRYINSIYSDVVRDVLLPLDREALREAFGGDKIPEPETIGEEARDDFLRYAVRQYLALRLYEAAQESLVCEHSARRNAMNNASDNADEMLTRLQLSYNRARQADITNDIIEIISGAQANRQGR